MSGMEVIYIRLARIGMANSFVVAIAIAILFVDAALDDNGTYK